MKPSSLRPPQRALAGALQEDRGDLFFTTSVENRESPLYPLELSDQSVAASTLSSLIHPSDAPIVKSRRRHERCLHSDRRRRGGSRDQDAVDLSGDVALETAHDLPLALALGGASCHVCLGAPIPAHSNHTD